MPVQFGRDTFTRANQSGWGNATDGQTYTQKRGNQALSISGNEGVLTFTSSATTGIVQMGTTTIGDSMMIVRATQGSLATDIIGVCPRFQDANNFYEFVQGSTSGHFQFRKDVATTFTTIADVAFTSTPGTFYWIRSWVIGTSFFGKIWQDQTAEPNTWTIGALGVTDASLAGPQGFGLVGAPQSGSTVSFDNLYVIDSLNSDDLTATDSSTAAGAGSPVDALSAADVSFAGGAVTATDALNTVESLLAEQGYAATDALSAAESLLSQSGYTAIDQVLAVEALTVVQGAQQIGSAPASSSSLSQGSATFLDQLVILDFSSGRSASIPVTNAIMRARKGSIVLIARRS